MDQERKDIEDLIKDHLKVNQHKHDLSDDFNFRLMNKIKEEKLKPESYSFHSYMPPTWSLMLGLQFCLILLASIYFLSSISLEGLGSWSQSFDFSYLHNKGIRYSIFALATILFFTFVDQFLQIRSRKFSS